MKATDHFVYILKCADGTLYTGYTTDIKKRIDEHNGVGNKPGARYTRGRRPVALVYQEEWPTRSKAQQRECAIKTLPRGDKLQLCGL